MEIMLGRTAGSHVPQAGKVEYMAITDEQDKSKENKPRYYNQQHERNIPCHFFSLSLSGVSWLLLLVAGHRCA